MPLVPVAKVFPFVPVTVALGVLDVLQVIEEEQVLAPAVMVQGFGEALMVPVGAGFTVRLADAVRPVHPSPWQFTEYQ